MSTKIYVNLPVKDLDKSREFYGLLGYSFNDQFSDENAACLVISDDIFVMLLTEPFFKNFTSKAIADATTTAAAIVALGVENRERVDELVDKALAAGGQSGGFSSDEGFMYGRSFADLDGHNWEVMYMDESALQG